MVLFPLCKPYNNQIWQDGKLAYVDLILQLMMMPLSLGQVIDFYGFVYTFINPITTELGRLEDHHTLNLSFR